MKKETLLKVLFIVISAVSYGQTLTFNNKVLLTEEKKPNVIVKIKTDNYGKETSWLIKDAKGRIVMNGKGYSNNQLFTTKKHLVKGCYTFEVKDTYGDGMCCKYGKGFYEVSFEGKIIAKGGSFKAFESKKFCIAGDDNQLPPTAPKKIVATKVTGNSIALSWDTYKNTNISGYYVYLGYGGGVAAVVTTNFVKIEGLKPNKFYTFFVKAFNKKGETSKFSNPIHVKTKSESLRNRAFVSIANSSVLTVQKKFDAFTVYPNPVNRDYSNVVVIKKSNIKNGTFTIINSNNQVVKSGRFHEEIALDVRGLPSGVYLIKVLNTDSILTKRLIIN